jgi:L-glyceraldehyde 3-phosphate reductase
VGISTYDPQQTRQAAKILRNLGTPCLIHQPHYNMFSRWIEDGLLDVLAEEGIGCIAFSPLAQGILTDKYLQDIPDDSRSAKWQGQLHWGDSVNQARLVKVRKLNEIARARGQTMAQLAVAWVLRHKGMTSALIGASRVSQIEDIVATLNNLALSAEELKAIETILAE